MVFLEREDLMGCANARLLFRGSLHHVHEVLHHVLSIETRHQVHEGDRPLAGKQDGLHLVHHLGMRLEKFRGGALEGFQIGRRIAF